MAESFQGLVIATVGPHGVGKTAFCKNAHSLHVSEISPELSEKYDKISCVQMRSVLNRHSDYSLTTPDSDNKWDPEALQLYHYYVRETENEGVNSVVDLLHDYNDTPRTITLVDSLYSPSDIDYFKKLGGHIIGLEATVAECRSRFASRQENGKMTTHSEYLWMIAQKELNSNGDPLASDINKCLEIAREDGHLVNADLPKHEVFINGYEVMVKIAMES